MIQPNCPKCGGTNFVSLPANILVPNGVYLIYCSKCGCVVGAVCPK